LRIGLLRVRIGLPPVPNDHTEGSLHARTLSRPVLVGWRRVGVVFGLLMLGFVVLYIVLVELHTHGYLGGT